MNHGSSTRALNPFCLHNVATSSSILSNLSSSWTSKPPLAVKYRLDASSLEEPSGSKSPCSTLERLLAWEKKLYDEVKDMVDIPPWFSAVSIALNSDVDLDLSKVERISESSLPIICFRDGSPPLPDALNTSLKESAITGLNGLDVEQCFMEKNITMKLTNEQISPGAWYIGLFNGIGATRTQSKMIIRGSSYSFSANISVEACSNSMMRGESCNSTVYPLSCSASDAYNTMKEMVKKPLMENVMTCKSNIETFCVQEGVPELYSLEITNVAEELTIMAAILKLKNLLNILILRRGSTPFESYYLPVGEEVYSANFPLEPLLNKSSNARETDDIWTYFTLDIPHGAAGRNIHIKLLADVKINYEVYAKFGGLPSLDFWDYYYANRTQKSEQSMFFMLYDSSDEKIDFYIIYAREGTWGLGLRHLDTSSDSLTVQTVMSISLEGCPKQCSSHGDCKYSFDASGLTSYSFCSCDRNHGGFDCSVEIVSHKGHILQSIFLIGSNVAAILPAYWSLQQKAFAEWILFTSSGIARGIYHACDVDTWCILSFNVLQVSALPLVVSLTVS
ncbi:hypothetical protein Fmac_024955 [Flemingia macrophylla]|uniref:EGF-like domain-containing protein n=1 Tax=Flemingia macrophylla TaxID=520843 RepID=A0ABD1LQV2_9FABA